MLLYKQHLVHCVKSYMMSPVEKQDTHLHGDKSVFYGEKAGYPTLGLLQGLLQRRGGGGWLVQEGEGGIQEGGGRARDGKVAAYPLTRASLLLNT